MLRRWLTRKQSETICGRAELLLESRAAVWSSRPDRRYLPSFLEWARLGLLTSWSSWTAAQRKMMRSATAYHTARIAGAAVLIATLSGLGVTGYSRLEHDRRARTAKGLVDTLLACRADHLKEAVARLAPFRGLWEDDLTRRVAEAGHTDAERTRAYLALAGSVTSATPFLLDRLLQADPVEHEAIRWSLAEQRRDVSAQLWPVLTGPESVPARRLRAAALLANEAPDDPRWSGAAESLARGLAAEPLAHVPTWADALKPIASQLLGPLAEVDRDGRRPGPERLNAAVAVETLGGLELGVRRLITLLGDVVESGDFLAVVSRLNVDPAHVVPLVRDELSAELEPAEAADEAALERRARRRANAAIALIHLGQSEQAWPLLRGLADPATRDLLIHRLVPFGVDPGVLFARFVIEDDSSARQALLLALGDPAARLDAGRPSSGVALESLEAASHGRTRLRRSRRRRGGF